MLSLRNEVPRRPEDCEGCCLGFSGGHGVLVTVVDSERRDMEDKLSIVISQGVDGENRHNLPTLHLHGLDHKINWKQINEEN